ncbi:MAG TPA: flagella basal body P-ring formation protein FlgA, partial [Bacteroidetes bacterium]|nr:flagella basal body P-ring formation protein FlgA [Bacteroidota bacterium]
DNDVIISLISAVNTRTKRMIKANTVLKNSMIEEIPAVNYNDKVVVVVKTKNLSIAASGTARQEGKIGEEVRIQREGSREFLSAKVVGKQTVEIIVR